MLPAFGNEANRSSPVALSGRRGVALMIVVGLLALLMMLGVAFSVLLRAESYVASVRVGRVRAGIHARSGIEYALARLTATPEPVAESTWTDANAADDWTYRDGYDVPLAESRNPSWRTGEGYADGNGNGRFDDGTEFDAAVHDRNGNGAYDPFSGRLRGTHGSHTETFQLRVAASNALVCINDGEIVSADDENNNGVPDHRDPAHPANVHMAGLLDDLGWILGTTSAATVARLAPQYPPGTPDMETSSLGREIISARPRGGYPSVAALEEVLNETDYRKIRPYVSLDAWRGPHALRRTLDMDLYGDGVHLVPTRRAPILLNHAPRPLIEAVFRYMGRAAWDGVVEVEPAEADRLADIFLADRPIRTWIEFYTWLDQRRLAGDFADTWGGNPAPERPTRLQDMVFMLLYPYTWAPSLESRSWISLGIPRSGPDEIGGITPVGLPLHKSQLLEHAGFGRVRFVEGSLMPHALGAYTAESLGVVRGPDGSVEAHDRVRAEFRLGGALCISAQEDFENFDWEIREGSPPAGIPHADGVHRWGRGQRIGTQTYPKYSLDSISAQSVWDFQVNEVGSTYGRTWEEVWRTYRFLDGRGSVRLGQEIPDGTGTAFYLPFREDGTPDWKDSVGDPLHGYFPDGNVGGAFGSIVMNDWFRDPLDPLFANCTHGCRGSLFRWGSGASAMPDNPGSYPFGQGGIFEEGSMVGWVPSHGVALSQVKSLSMSGMFRLDFGPEEVVFQMGSSGTPLSFPLSFPPDVDAVAWRHWAYTWGPGGTNVYVDGVELPGAHDPFYDPMMCGIRGSVTAKGCDDVRGWTAEIDPLVDPSRDPAVLASEDRYIGTGQYVSPEFRMPDRVRFLGARWDLFLPEGIRDEVFLWSMSNVGTWDPLRVGLDMYDGASWTGPQFFPLPDNGMYRVVDRWGERIRLRLEFNMDPASRRFETPTFEGIVITYAASPQITHYEVHRGRLARPTSVPPIATSP